MLLEIAINLAMLAFAVTLAVYGFDFMQMSGETTPFLRLDKAWWYAAIPFCSGAHGALQPGLALARDPWPGDPAIHRDPDRLTITILTGQRHGALERQGCDHHRRRGRHRRGHR